MDSYQVVADTLGNRETRKVANNSYLTFTEGQRDREGHPGQRGTIAYRLHGTYVVLYHHNGTVELNSGGWRTVTTKDRINRCFSDYGPTGYRVYSTNRVWHLYRHGERVAEFADGMVIHPDDSITGAMTTADIRKRDASNAKLDKLVRAYIAKLTPAKIVKACNNMAGDCLFCQMERGGANVPGTMHLWDHLSERYYMGSLFLNALTHCHYGPALPGLVYMAAKGEMHGNTPHVDATLTRCLARYFRDKLRAV
jgi:hypothetical protein